MPLAEAREGHHVGVDSPFPTIRPPSACRHEREPPVQRTRSMPRPGEMSHVGIASNGPSRFSRS
jgi:hypothetical protein